MFAPDAPPLPWDGAGEYCRARVQLYYLARAGTPLTQPQLVAAMAGRWPERLDESGGGGGPRRYGPGAAEWVAVREGDSLREVLLAPGHVVPGIPLFWCVARGSDYAARFLAGR